MPKNILQVVILGAPQDQLDLRLKVLLGFALDMNHRPVGINPDPQHGLHALGTAAHLDLPLAKLQLLTERRAPFHQRRI